MRIGKRLKIRSWRTRNAVHDEKTEGERGGENRSQWRREESNRLVVIYTVTDGDGGSGGGAALVKRMGAP